MRKEITRSTTESRVEWDHLEEWVRGQVQCLIQEMLEDEVTEFLGRARSARRSSLDGVSGYRNGYSKPRRLTLSSGTIRVKRPRVRNTEEFSTPRSSQTKTTTNYLNCQSLTTSHVQSQRRWRNAANHSRTLAISYRV